MPPPLIDVKRLALELKPNAQLNLPFAEEKAIRKIAWRCESRIVSCAAGDPSHAGNIINPVVNASYLRAVKDIEELAKYFNLGILFDREPPRKSQVDDWSRHSWQTESGKRSEPFAPLTPPFDSAEDAVLLVTAVKRAENMLTMGAMVHPLDRTSHLICPCW